MISIEQDYLKVHKESTVNTKNHCKNSPLKTGKDAHPNCNKLWSEACSLLDRPHTRMPRANYWRNGAHSRDSARPNKSMSKTEEASFRFLMNSSSSGKVHFCRKIGMCKFGEQAFFLNMLPIFKS